MKSALLQWLVVYISSLVLDFGASRSMPLQNDSVMQKYQGDRLNLRTDVLCATEDFDHPRLPTRKRIVLRGGAHLSPQPTNISLIKAAEETDYRINDSALLSARAKSQRTRASERRELLDCGGGRRRRSVNRRSDPVADSFRQMRSHSLVTNDKREYVLQALNSLRRRVKPSAANMLFMVRHFIRPTSHWL